MYLALKIGHTKEKNEMQEHAEGPRSGTPRVCPECGAANAAMSETCDACGASLAEIEAPGRGGRRERKSKE